jgi:hypothetical protein
MTVTTAEPAQAEIRFYRKPLYKLLATTFARFETGQGLFDVAGFAAAIGMSHEGVYKWIRSDRISPIGARKVIELSAGVITKEQMLPFVMG